MSSHSRSNADIFNVLPTGSPVFGNLEHISKLGLDRYSFERCKVFDTVILSIEGDLSPTSQQDDEARIGSLAHAFNELGNKEDAAEFVRCLNVICEGGDARSRQVVASCYYSLAKEKGVSQALKDMALIAMGLSSLHPVIEEVESVCEVFCPPPRDTMAQPLFDPSDPNVPRDAADMLAERFDDAPAKIRSLIGRNLLFDYEVNAVRRKIRGRRRATGFAHDEWADWLSDLEAGGATSEELDSAFGFLEAMDQYDEGGAVIHMSEHERPVVRGRLDHEYTVEDLPRDARYLAGDLLRAYVSGVNIEEIWCAIDNQLHSIFPIHLVIDGPEAPRRTNRTTGLPDCRLSCEEIRAMDPDAGEVKGGPHLAALRNNSAYRRCFQGIRCATNAGRITEVMNQACLAHKSGAISHEELKSLQKEKDKQTRRLLSSEVVTYERPMRISHANREIQNYIREVLEALLNEYQEDFHLTGLRANRAYRDFHCAVRRSTTQAEVSDALKQAFQARREGKMPLKLFTGLCATATKQRERLRSKPVGGGAYKLIEEILNANGKGLKRISWELYRNNRPEHPIHKLQEHEASLVWDVLNIVKTATACWTSSLSFTDMMIRATLTRALLRSSFVTVIVKRYPAHFMFLTLLKDFLKVPYLRNAIRAVINKQPSPQEDTSSPRRASSPARRPVEPAKKGGVHLNAHSSAPPA